MAKQGEIDYVRAIGEAGAEHARTKPFSDPGCGAMLTDIGGILMALPPPPGRLLDLGCGAGWSSVMYARRGYRVTGQDIAPDMIALAERNRAESGLANLDFVISDYEGLPYRDEFDAAVFYDALHHAEDPASAMASAWRALKPGGVLVTVEPGRGHAHAELSKQAVATYGVTERDMPPREVVRLGRAAGFRGARVYPMPKMFTLVQYQMPRPLGLKLPDWLGDVVRWGGLGYLMLGAKWWVGGMVVLRK